MKCRNDFLPTLQAFKVAAETSWTCFNVKVRRAKVVELRSIINFFCRRYFRNLPHSKQAFSILFEICNLLKASDEDTFLRKI